MITETELGALVGIPYSPDGMGPEEFSCWGLLMFIQQKYLNNSIPAVDINNPSEYLEIFSKQLAVGNWAQINDPADGDGVLLRSGTRPHVGVYFFGGVLHSLEDFGVIYTPLRQLPYQGFGRISFYRLHT